MKLVLIMEKPDYQHQYKHLNKYYNRNEILRIAAEDFIKKASKLPSVVEVAIFGSVTRDKPTPKDIDLAVIINNYIDIEILAKYSRQMNKFYHDWEVFLFSYSNNLKNVVENELKRIIENNLKNNGENEPENSGEKNVEDNLEYLGRICEKRECPGFTIECSQDCNSIPNVKHVKGTPWFHFKEEIFFKSKFEILYHSGSESVFLLEQKRFTENPHNKRNKNRNVNENEK